MCVNETRRMIIPSYLAYGTRGATVIVPRMIFYLFLLFLLFLYSKTKRTD